MFLGNPFGKVEIPLSDIKTGFVVSWPISKKKWLFNSVSRQGLAKSPKGYGILRVPPGLSSLTPRMYESPMITVFISVLNNQNPISAHFDYVLTPIIISLKGHQGFETLLWFTNV